MIQRIVAFALHQPLFTMMMAVLFIGGGIVAFRSLPIEAFPDVSDTQVNVIALYPGRAPEEVEKQVTIPLEVALNGLSHQVRLFSHTQFGLSFLMLTFDDKATDYFARQHVIERLQSADLPPGVEPQLAPLSTAIGEIYRYRVVGKGYSLMVTGRLSRCESKAATFASMSRPSGSIRISEAPLLTFCVRDCHWFTTSTTCRCNSVSGARKS